MKLKRSLLSIIFCFLIFSCSFTTVNAFTNEQKNKIQNFQNTYNQIDKTHYNYQNIYSQKPAFTIPSFAGLNSKEYLKQYDQAFNFVRSLFDLAPAVQTEFENQVAISGAYSMASVPKNDGSNIQHGLVGLTKPFYVDELIWKKGSEATREGNIANIVPDIFSKYAHQSVWDDVMGFVVDNNNYDINHVGHRDWMLSQEIKSYGIGTIYTDPSNSITNVNNGGENIALGYQVFYWGKGYDGEPNDNLIQPLTYPAKNVFPIELMNSNNPLKPVCWSIGFSDSQAIDVKNKPQIVIKNLNNGFITQVDPQDIYYESDYGGYDTVYSFIPRGIELNVDQPYQITFSNLKLKSKDNSTINEYSYQVSFFNLNDKSGNSDDYTNAGRVVYVNYQPNFGVRIYEQPGKNPTNTFAFHGTDWIALKDKKDSKGRTWTQIGSNQWIPLDYLTTNINGEVPVGKVNYVPGYGINLWKGFGNKKIFSGKRLPDGSNWKVYKKAIVGDTYWFNLGGDLWVDGEYLVIIA